jgi:hypothetical protein
MPGAGGVAVTFRDGLRQAVHRIRAIPNAFGVRPYSVVVRTKTWSGAEVGEGSTTTVNTAITEHDGTPPKVRWLDDQEIALGGYSSGSIEIGPVTPDFPGGGTLLALLAPDPAVNSTVQVIITGPAYPSGGVFRIRDVEHHRGYQYRLRCEKAAE